jgi:arsenate reductase (thioredoxin)
MPQERPFKALDGRACRKKVPSSLRKKVLFLCTMNSTRSQMAEALLNGFHGDKYEGYSAGVRPGTRVDPYVIGVLAEIGIDASKARPKSVEEMLDIYFDIVVTVCDSAREECQIYPGGSELMHRSFAAPSSFEGDADGTIQQYRTLRDEMRAWIDATFN